MYSNIMVELILSGDVFDPEIVTRALQINPTKQGIKGEKTPARGNFFWKRTLWIFDTGYRDIWETSPVFLEIIDLFEPKIPIIKSLMQANNLSVSVCFVTSVEGISCPHISLDSRQISFLHELNATLNFDQYWSPDENEENEYYHKAKDR